MELYGFIVHCPFHHTFSSDLYSSAMPFHVLFSVVYASWTLRTTNIFTYFHPIYFTVKKIPGKFWNCVRLCVAVAKLHLWFRCAFILCHVILNEPKPTKWIWSLMILKWVLWMNEVSKLESFQNITKFQIVLDGKMKISIFADCFVYPRSANPIFLVDYKIYAK